jgi:hypothetical protein
MENTTSTRTQPTLVRLLAEARCGCGETVPRGERVGYVSSREGVLCLACLADHQAGRLDLAAELGDEVVVDDAERAEIRRTQEAAHHRRRVTQSAEDLLHRLFAIRAMGALDGAPRPLEDFVPRVG